jgi:hypothetical protein
MENVNKKKISLDEIYPVIKEKIENGGTVQLPITGTSMLPLLVWGRDTVELTKCENPQKYDIIFYRRDNGQFILHRILKICNDGTYILCGDNQTNLEKGIRPDQVIGYISEIKKQDKRLSASTLSYRLYMLFWMWMPYRKTVLFIKRGFRFLKRKLNKK